MSQNNIAVLGAGSWGTALALLLARRGQSVRLWGHDPASQAVLAETRCNQRYLPGCPFPPSLHVYADLSDCLTGVRDILIVVPSFAFAQTLHAIKPYLSVSARVVWGTKGLEAQTARLFHALVKEILGDIPMAVLSGPTLAKEVAAGLPTAVALATEDVSFAHDLLERFHGSTFRVYQNTDIVGVELCGVVKNVLAIAAGISDGMQLGSNARSALITRGLAEMRRLCLAVGGREDTVMGLAGMGDLILTATDDQSRNRRFGRLLGQGVVASEALTQIGQAVEGWHNARQVHQLAEQYRVVMPITQVVFRVLYEGLAPQDALTEILGRDPVREG